MLHTCAARFDVNENLENFWFFGRTKQGLNRGFGMGALLYEMD